MKLIVDIKENEEGLLEVSLTPKEATKSTKQEAAFTATVQKDLDKVIRNRFDVGLSHQSETDKARPQLGRFCIGTGLDVGFGGDPIVDTAICVDLAQPYTNVGPHKVQVAINHPFDVEHIFRPFSLDYIYSSHLLEDFSYMENYNILRSWFKLLKEGGVIVINCPDQQAYLEHNKALGFTTNTHHIEQDFSLANYKDKCIPENLTVIFENELINDYSWQLVLKKEVK